MPINLEDKKLARRLLAGREQAFNQFFDENFARLYRFILPRVSHEEEAAQEIVQAAMARALRRISTYRGEAALFTWLCAIARNEMLDWMRRQSRYRERIVLTEDEPALRAAVDSLLAPGSQQPGMVYQQHELSRLIQVALDLLPPKYGDALEWKYIEGQSVREIAARLQLSPEAAQSLLARARRAFHDVYGSLARPLIEETSP